MSAPVNLRPHALGAGMLSAAMSTPSASHPSLTHNRILALLVLAFVVIAGSAMLRTSTTFDEIVFPAVGARGIAMGDFGLVNDHPRLPQYLFGLPVYLSGVKYPSENGHAWHWLARYDYARLLFWGMGNDSERLVLLTRLVGLAFGTLTVIGAFFLGKRHLGAGAALFAAALVAFLPDMLAHSGVAYNDIVLTFGVLASVYALDGAVRRPAPGRVALAALVCALTACTKYSGLIVGPLAIGLLLLEALSGRWRDRAWTRAILLGAPIFILVCYATIALVYLGDWRLADFTRGLGEITRTSSGRVAYLLGERKADGWWYFFPVALALKTPVALHLLALLAIIGAWIAGRGGSWREWPVHRARAPALGAALFIGALLVSGMNIGSRHALPALPLLCILVAQGIAPIWDRGRTAMRAALALVFATYMLSTLLHYPYFLSYLSEYARGRALHETLVDSSTDWGQGLVALRAFMRERGIGVVALAYFGSALPEGYGIRYVALPSFLDLPEKTGGSAVPRYAVISATLLSGIYLDSDPYAAMRGVKPIAVVAETLYVYDLEALGKL
jgi:4-amino-4-deoxy-L-arabinose transferase-like glycosyltransferase